ncbi:MAG: protein kinase, partial [Pirellulales bacterium]
MPSLSEEEIFAAALEQPSPHERRAFLDRACQGDVHLRAQVEALLAAHDHPDSFLEPPAAGVAGTVDVPPLQEKPGTLIGPYKLLQVIGEGGMGVVFMAEQTQPVQRKVALKVIKPGMDSRQVIARFEAERQALAMMDHVNIARVFDAGATDAGRPYFVMELVHGAPITQYCDDNHLTPRERLELFVPVCQAIQHAHQKGIIHRDIKPSNVMITLYDGKPVPKVIDFGVAKATEQKLTERTLFTQYGTMVGTLEYMSPEQAEMSALGIDTRSDIYSLGVLLYELLTGSTPLSHKRVKEVAYAEILRMIKEEEPPKPSTRLSDSGEALASISANRHTEPAKLTKLVRGELDWIVMKTLEKDRNRRYETASGFAADVQRYLNDEPVQACPPSATYRLKKFLRRNKEAVLAAAVVVLALVAGIIGTTWGMIRAADAEASAVQEAEQKELALNDKIKALAAAKTSEQDAKSKEALAKEARKEAVESLKDARAAVDQLLTRVAHRVANVPQMEPLRRDLLQDALKFHQKFLQKKSDDPEIRLETAVAYWQMAAIHHQLGQSAEAEVGYSKAIAMFKELDAEAPLEPRIRRELISIHLEFSWVLGHLGKREEIEKNVRRAVQIAEDLVKDFPKDPHYRLHLANACNYLWGHMAQTRPEEAEKILTRNLTLTNEPRVIADTYHGLGYLAAAQGRNAEAEKLNREALKHVEKFASEQPGSNHLQNS